MYHLLTGKFPYDNMDPIRAWNPMLDPGLEAIIEKCIQTRPEDRFQSCAELIYAFKHYNEYGEAYRNMQKKKLKKFVAATASAVGFLLTGIICLSVRSGINNADFDQNILQAEKAATAEEKIDYYGRAIDIKPAEISAYTGMIDAMKDDAVFTVEESNVLTSKITTNDDVLRNQEGYAELAFEIGKLYWYYYDYGNSGASDNQVTRMKSAIQWFTDAVEYGDTTAPYYQMSKVYASIGEFNRDITMNVQEASDQGQYATYWENIKELLTYIEEQEDANEFVQLEIYKLSYSTIETYAKKLKSDGIAQNDMQSVYQEVTSDIERMETTSDTTGEIQTDLKARAASVQDAITNAYREQVVSNE